VEQPKQQAKGTIVTIMSNLPTPKPELESVLQRRKKTLGEVIAQMAETGLTQKQIEEKLKAEYSIPEATMNAIDKHCIEAQVKKAALDKEAVVVDVQEADEEAPKARRKPKAEKVAVLEEAEAFVPVDVDAVLFEKE